MAAPAYSRARLCAVVEASIARAGDLQRTLENERLALQEQDGDALRACAEAKQAGTLALAALDEERRALCEALRLPVELTTVPPPAGDDPENRLARSWERLLQIAERCAELNRTNGGIINLRRRQVAEALHIIGGERAETYGPGRGDDIPDRKRAIARI